MSEPNNVLALSRFRADVGRALATRAQALLAAPDLAERVPALAPLEAYFLVKEVGVGEALPILAHATPEQLQAFVDLDCWEGDRPSVTELDAWLAPFAAEGQESLARVYSDLEEEIQIMFLADSVHIYDLRSEEAPEAGPNEARMTTPDGFFVLVPKDPSVEREVEPFILVQSLYRASLEQAFGLLMAAKWEMGAETEERALQFRTARLQDMGFPEPALALKLFAPPPPHPRPPLRTPAAMADAMTLPAVYAAPLTEGTLLSRALAQISDAHEVERLERELIELVNAAIIAYGESPRDVTHVGEIATRVRDTLSLGLETLLLDAGVQAPLESAEAVARAASSLAQYVLVDVFRFGHREVAKLQAAARALATDPVHKAWLDRGTPEGEEYTRDNLDQAFWQALLSPRPLYAGWEPLHPERLRAFATRAEVAAAEQRLDAIAKRIT